MGNEIREQLTKKLSFEWGNEEEGDTFQQQEFYCRSFKATDSAVIMVDAQVLPGGWIFEEIGIPLAGLRRWFVGEGVGSLKDLPPKPNVGTRWV